MLTRTWKCKLSTIAFLEKISNSLNFSTKISSVERDHCIVKLLGLKDISSLHTQWNKMVFPIFHVFQLNLHMIFESNVSFQNHIQIGKFMKWNYMTSSWNYKVHVDHSTHETLQYQLQWPVYWNLKTHFIILALDSVEEGKKNRSILTAIIKLIKFCVRNGVAVRGHRYDGALNSNDISKESGNLKSLINSRMKSW